MMLWEVNIIALSEPCVDWHDVTTRRVFKKISTKYNTNGCYTVATSSLKVANPLKPGGALLHSDNEWAGRITEKGTDPWGYGRWSYQVYSGGSSRSLLVISAYRVGKRVPEHAGTTTAWYQQQVLICENNREGDPAELFITDFIEWTKEKRHSNMEIILMLDANEKWGNNSKIKQMADTLDLHNPFNEIMQEDPITHPNFSDIHRSTTIDFCLVSTKVIDQIKYITMTPYDLQTLGDHRGMIIDVNIKKLLAVDSNTLENTAGRKLSTGNPQSVQKYLKKREREVSQTEYI